MYVINKERGVNMYITTEMLGDKLTEIMEKKEGVKDFYKLETVINVITNHIDDLNYDIEDLKDQLNDLENDDYDESNDYFKEGE